MKKSKYFFLSVLFLFSISAFPFSLKDFEKILQKYSQNSGVKMSFKKETNLELLKKKKVSEGEIFLSKGRVLLKIKDHLNTQILFDGNHLWYIRLPIEEKKQIVKVNLKTKGKNNMLISFLFKSDLFFQNFRFISSRFKGRSRILSFEPKNPDSEIQFFSVKVEGKLILAAWLRWKNLGNEEKYRFFNIRFNQNIPISYFQIDTK